MRASVAGRRGALRLGLVIGLVLGAVPSNPQDPPAGGPPGQTATLLPDGRVLLLGGEGPTGVLATAEVWDPRTGVATPVPGGLSVPRAWQSASMLPDGTVWIFGGVGVDGRLVDPALVFHPETQTFDIQATPGLAPRTGHTATVLTSGQVLIAGGVGAQGTLEAEIQRWDPVSRTVVQTGPALLTPRQRQTATLEADGTVQGGLAADSTALSTGEQYDPQTGQITAVRTPPALSSDPPRLETSLPVDGATAVPLDAGLALRFSAPLRVDTLTPSTVTLAGPQGLEPLRIVPAEGGRLLFVTPAASLSPGAGYTLLVNGAADPAGQLVPPAEVRFTTGPATMTATPGAGAFAAPTRTNPRADTSVLREADDAAGDPWVWPGAWRDGKPYSPWQALAPFQAPDGVTALAGQVLQLNGEPLAHVTLEFTREPGTRRLQTQTDDTGRFLLRDLPTGHRELLIDGRSASRPGRTYGVFEAGVELVAGQTTVLPFTIWMPRIDTQYAVPIPAELPNGLVVTTPRVPGLEVHLPPDAVVRDHEGRLAREISLTPIPLDRTPFPLPPIVDPPVYFTIQPGGGYVDAPNGAGARIIYPNYAGDRREPPGTPFRFWHYDPARTPGWTGWQIYGPGAVAPDGRQIIPDPGVAIYEFTGAMATPPTGCTTPPGCAPPPPPPGCSGQCMAVDPVDLSTGLFILTKIDLALPDVVPVTLTRTYRPNDPETRPFGIGATHPYQWFLALANGYLTVDLILPAGDRIHYVRTSAGTGFSGAAFAHTATPSSFYQSTIVWNAGANAWQLTLRDGWQYFFPANAPLQRIVDRFGNALTLTRSPDVTGDLTSVASPNGRLLQFSYDASHRITQARDSLGRVVSYAYDASGRLTTVTDPNGGVTQYTYDASNRMVTLTDAQGILFLTNAYDANGRVTQQTQADATTYQLAYTLDGTGKVTQTDVTDPRGFVERLTFNGDGYPLSTVRALGQPEQQTTTYTRQSGTNLVTAMTDPLGRQTTYTYDSQGNVASVTRLAGTGSAVTTSSAYDPTFSQVTSVTDPLNHTTTFGYDAQGRLTSVTDPSWGTRPP